MCKASNTSVDSPLTIELIGPTCTVQPCVVQALRKVMDRMFQVDSGQGIETDFCFHIHDVFFEAYRMPSSGGVCVLPTSCLYRISSFVLFISNLSFPAAAELSQVDG
jgi:hypothetical protein